MLVTSDTNLLQSTDDIPRFKEPVEAQDYFMRALPDTLVADWKLANDKEGPRYPKPAALQVRRVHVRGINSHARAGVCQRPVSQLGH